MANGISSSIDSKKLLKALKKLPLNIERNVMVGSTRAGATVVSDEAKRLVSKNSGTLKKSIGIIKRKTKKGITTFSVSPRRGGNNDGFYAKFLEFGTFAHFTGTLKKPRYGRLGRIRKLVVAKGGGIRPRPFLRPALEKSVDEVLKASKEYIAKRLPKEVAKAKK